MALLIWAYEVASGTLRAGLVIVINFAVGNYLLNHLALSFREIVSFTTENADLLFVIAITVFYFFVGVNSDAFTKIFFNEVVLLTLSAITR